jgi:arylsulfatase
MRLGKFIIPLALSLSVLSLASCSRSEFKVKKPNILFLLLDTLRADHLSGYGYERETSPVLDAFAKENLKFDFALTAAPWTPASVASMFTGLYPSSHGMMPPNDRDIAKKGYSRLASSHITLAEILQGNGYKTLAVSPNPWVTKEFGYDQGFDEYYYLHRKIAEEITESGRELVDSWLKTDQKNPFFMYLHFLDPHDPYSPPGEYAKRFSGPLSKSPFSYDDKMLQNIGLYDGEIKYLDTEIGKFFDYLKAKGLYEDLFIVIVADHGEQFMEHGNLRHGYKLYNEEIHVPLILKTGREKDKGRVISETVATIDILPTIIQRLGLEPHEKLPGISVLNEEDLKTRKGVLSEIRRIYSMKSLTDPSGNRLILQQKYNQKHYEQEDSLQGWLTSESIGVFETKKDIVCSAPLKNPALEARLKGSFDEILASAIGNTVKPDEGGNEIKNETLDQLKSLGYLQ